MEQAHLTSRQRKVLNFVEAFSREHGFPPTLREIGRAVSLDNVNAVRGHVTALEKKGYITRAPEKARSIRVVRTDSGLGRLKRSLHKVLRTDEGVLHRVVYGLAWTTWRLRPYFAGVARDWLEEALRRECAAHGWKASDLRIHPDHVIVAVEVWPNHSPERAIRRFKSAGRAVKRRHMSDFPGRWLWSKGYAVTTDLSLLDGLAGRLIAERREQMDDSPP